MEMFTREKENITSTTHSPSEAEGLNLRPLAPRSDALIDFSKCTVDFKGIVVHPSEIFDITANAQRIFESHARTFPYL